MKKNPNEQSTAPGEILFSTWTSRIASRRKWLLFGLLLSFLLLIAWAAIMFATHGRLGFAHDWSVGSGKPMVSPVGGEGRLIDPTLQYSMGVFILLFAAI